MRIMKRRQRRAGIPQTRRSPSSYVLLLERLEDRLTPATHTWSGAVSNLWSADANWDGGSPAGDASADLSFPAGAHNLSNNNDLTDLTVSSLTFGGGGYTINGAGLSLLTGATISASAGFNTLRLNLRLGGPATFTVDSGPALFLSGSITGPREASLTKEGAGVVEVGSSNAYLGDTILDAGTLEFGGGLSFGTGTVMLNSGVLLYVGNTANLPNPFTVNGSVTIDNQAENSLVLGGPGYLAADASLHVSGSRFGYLTAFTGGLAGEGSLIVASGSTGLFGPNSYSGGTSLSPLARLTVGSGSSLGTGPVDLNGSTLEVMGSATLANQLTISASATIDGPDGLSVTGPCSIPSGVNLTLQDTVTLRGDLDGAGSLTVGTSTVSGVVSLTGDNTYTGGTTVRSGTLTVGRDTSLGTGPLSMYGSRLQSSSAVTLANPFSFMVGSLIVPVTVAGSHDLTLAGAGSFGTGTATALNISADSGTVITLSGGVSGRGNLQVQSGVLVLAGSNSYSGQTLIQAPGVLRLGADDAIPSDSAVTVAANAQLDLNNFNLALGSLSGVGTVSLGSGTLTIGPGPVNNTFDGSITGSGSLVRMGAFPGDTLTLSGDSSYSGGTTIAAGAVLAASDHALGTGLVTLVPGVTLSTSATVTLPNDFTFQGPALSAVSLRGNFSGAGALATGTNLLVSGTFSGVISGGGGLRVTEEYTTTILAAPNTYTGGTYVKDSRLQLGAANAIPSTSDLTLISDQYPASVDLNGFPDTVGSLSGGNPELPGILFLHGATLTVGADNTSTIFGDQIAGPGRLVKVGTGTLTLGGASVYTGGTDLVSGTLVAHDTLALGVGAVTLEGGSLVASNALGNPLIIDGAATLSGVFTGPCTLQTPDSVLIASSSGTVTLSGPISGPGQLDMQGPGTLSLFGANDYSGGTTLEAGTLDVTSDTALGNGPLALDGGTLKALAAVTLANPFTVGGLATIGGSYDLTLAGPGTLTGDPAVDSLTVAAAANVTLADLTQSGGALVAASDLRIDQFTFSGGTLQVQTGTVAIGGDFASAGAVLIAAGSSLMVDGVYTQTAGTTLLAGGTLAAGGGVLLEGGVLSGSGSVDADVVNAAEIDVGTSDATGVLTINGDYTQTAAGILSLKLGGLGIDNPPNDQLAVTGTASLDGTLNVTLLADFTANAGDSYQALSFGALSGAFATTNLPDLGNGLVLDPVYASNSLNLVVTPT